MGSRFDDLQHVIRLAVVFAVALIAFLAWRAWMVPDDFGVYGHYRAGALADARLRPVVYAGQATCSGGCHIEIVALRQAGGHALVACESCHGPLASHAADTSEESPQRPDGRTGCTSCHAAGTGKPSAFPQVAVGDHAGEAACVDCHQPHSPGMQ